MCKKNKQAAKEKEDKDQEDEEDKKDEKDKKNKDKAEKDANANTRTEDDWRRKQEEEYRKR